MVVIDLDNRATYADLFDKILYAKEVWPILESDFRGSQEKLGELCAEPDCIHDPLLKKLQSDCEHLFHKTYSHVTAYHSCRTDDSKKYFQYGLLTATPERLEAMAREKLAGQEDLEKGIVDAKTYFNAFGDSVHMFISAEFADVDYLKKGSLYLRKVGGRSAGEGGCKDKPVFVKCRIPVSWLQDVSYVRDYKFLYRYVSSMMSRCIWAKACPNEKYYEGGQTLALFKDIPPENILEILDAGVCVNWR
jgi:hypothetical protein